MYLVQPENPPYTNKPILKFYYFFFFWLGGEVERSFTILRLLRLVYNLQESVFHHGF